VSRRSVLVTTRNGESFQAANGAAVAAFLAAGIGTFTMGIVIVLNEAGIFSAPALYGPAGGVSGRTTIAAAVWLIAWAALHHRWKDRALQSGRCYMLALVLAGLGILLAFPPVWAIL
jgi:hypothetical protein